METNYENVDKEFFRPGMVVTLKLDVPNKPVMIVVRKETNMFRSSEEAYQNSKLRGIKCRWFTKDGFLQEATFNTKDIKAI